MKIKFSCDTHLLGVIPSPIPAIKAAPDYFRAVKPQSSNHPSSGTVKRCVPFLDALSAGFIIPMWCDVYVLARNGELSIDFPPNFAQKETLGSHGSVQIPKHPLANKPYGNMPMKWINPWILETEPEISCIFTSPLNHMETRFKLLDGVVDTDKYYNNINFPFLWTGGDGEFFIAKGTPLVQIIPFRREDHHLELSAIESDRCNATRSSLGTRLKNAYREEMWHGRKIGGKVNDEADPIGQIDASQITLEPSINQTTGMQTDEEILHQNGYIVLPKLITQADADQFTLKLREYIEKTNAKPDRLCPKSQAVHGMPEFDELLETLTPLVSKVSGRKLVPTNSYARMYVEGEVLPKHTDRPACQYSITLCLGMDGDLWPIYMARQAEDGIGTSYLAVDGTTKFMMEPSSVILQIGDGVLYLGMDMVHYRNALEGQWQAQVFLHWVDADGPHADQRYDGRLALSHHAAPEIDDNVIPLSTSSAMSSGILEVVADDTGRGFGEGSF